jgi:hypothetical protein
MVLVIYSVWLGKIIVDWIELNELTRFWDVVSVEWMLGSFEIVDEFVWEVAVLVTSFNEVWSVETEKMITNI